MRQQTWRSPPFASIAGNAAPSASTGLSRQASTKFARAQTADTRPGIACAKQQEKGATTNDHNED